MSEINQKLKHPRYLTDVVREIKSKTIENTYEFTVCNASNDSELEKEIEDDEDDMLRQLSRISQDADINEDTLFHVVYELKPIKQLRKLIIFEEIK